MPFHFLYSGFEIKRLPHAHHSSGLVIVRCYDTRSNDQKINFFSRLVFNVKSLHSYQIILLIVCLQIYQRHPDDTEVQSSLSFLTGLVKVKI